MKLAHRRRKAPVLAENVCFLTAWLSNSLKRVKSAIGSWYGSYAYFHEACV